MIEPKEDLISSPQAQSIERVAWSGVRAYATFYLLTLSPVPFSVNVWAVRLVQKYRVTRLLSILG